MRLFSHDQRAVTCANRASPPPPTPSATSTPAPTSVDLNGIGTSADVALVTSWLGQTSPPAPSAYDVNHDGRSDINDIQMAQAHLGLNVCP